MPSLKSSDGSKSGTFLPATPTGVGSDCFVYRQEGRFAAINSSWINRLHLRAPPTASAASAGGGAIPTGDACANNLTVSTEESRIPSRSFYNPKSPFIARRFLGSTPSYPQSTRGNSDARLVAGFGPFQVREARKCAGRGFEKGFFSGDDCFPPSRRGEQKGEAREAGVFETRIRNEAIRARASPSINQFRSRFGRIGTGAKEKGISGLDPASSSKLQTRFGPWKVESNLKMPCQVTDSRFHWGNEGKSRAFGPILAGCSSRHPAGSSSAAYHDLPYDASVSRTFQNGHNMNQNAPSQRAEKQALVKESEEPFSFWNMGRFNRANYVSSASSSNDFSRKRDLNADDIINSSKHHRRTGCGD